MNLLEHYISEIHSEQTEGDYVRVVATINCYGSKKVINRLFSKSGWNEIKELGYYMG